MRRMCHDCPHKEEHETGTSILVVKGTCGKPHRCHNAPHLPCVGHEMQLENISAICINRRTFRMSHPFIW